MRFSRYMVSVFYWAAYRLLFERLTENGDGEIRTLDPLLARQVLSQLSYTPMLGNSNFFVFIIISPIKFSG
jgi:hypothetical protein